MLGSMQPFSSLIGLASQLRNDAVRELAWTLLAPPMIETTECRVRHPLAASGWATRPQLLADWLEQLDRAPAALREWLARQPIRRLGHYYECLWQFAVQAAPGVELLAHNLPVRDGNRTLGELDLLLRDEEGIHHSELAVKFYLGLPESGEVRWWGPNVRDRLDLKLAHLCRHQLALSSHPAARALLPEGPLDSSLWLGGWLFYPTAGALQAPCGSAAEHPRGSWRLFSEGLPSATAHWVELPRLSWLAPLRRAERPAPLTELAPLTLPRLLARMQQHRDGHWHEVERLFVMPGDWPARCQSAQRAAACRAQ